MTLIPEKRTVGYLISESPCETTTSQMDPFNQFIVFRYDWRPETEEEPITRLVDDFIDEQQLAACYAAFADEDRRLAEEGILEYGALLDAEDQSD